MRKVLRVTIGTVEILRQWKSAHAIRKPYPVFVSTFSQVLGFWPKLRVLESVVDQLTPTTHRRSCQRRPELF